MIDDNRIIFMGTPEFAAKSLAALCENDFNIVAVITAPDRKAGRGQKIRQSAVKEYALSQNLPILQPTNLKSDKFIAELKGYNAEMQFVVAFRMLPEAVWAMPKNGTVNLHASLLTNYRGAALINYAIVNGEKKTGITTFFIEKEIDTGKVIFREETKIEERETAGTLHDKLMKQGASLVCKTAKPYCRVTMKAKVKTNFCKAKKLNLLPKYLKKIAKLTGTNQFEKLIFLLEV